MDSKPAVARRVAFLLVGLAVFLGLPACGGGGEDGGQPEGTPTPPGATASSATPSGETVEITYWHTELASNLDTLLVLVRRYNESQNEVKVKLAFQGSKNEESMAKVLASLGSGELPTIVVLDEVQTQRIIDTQAFRPVQEFIDRDDYDLSDFDLKVVQFYTVDGKLQAMPISISVPLLYYNKATFREVGLDPDKPPKDLEELKEVSAKMVKRDSHGNLTRTGISLDILPWYLEVVLAQNGELYLNNENGREGRATAVAFDSPTGQALFQWWHDTIKEGLGVDVGRNPTGADNLLAIGSGQVAMTRSGSQALRSVVEVLEGGLAQTEVELAVAGVPGVSGGEGASGTYSRGLWFAKDRPEAEQEAGWKFVKWLMEPEQQAEWFAGTGYLPVRDSSYDLPLAQQTMDRYPQFRTAAEIFRSSPATPATVGALLGPFNAVRDEVVRGLEETVIRNKDPIEALNDAAQAANKIIEEYNDRLQ
jgi:sn-glycerol 3-phosphate transport system substrate-binding protein